MVLLIHTLTQYKSGFQIIFEGHQKKDRRQINCRNYSVRNNLRYTSMSWEHKKILFVLCIVLHFSLLLLSHHDMQRIDIFFYVYIFHIIALFTHRLDHVDINHHTILYQFKTYYDRQIFSVINIYCVIICYVKSAVPPPTTTLKVLF